MSTQTTYQWLEPKPYKKLLFSGGNTPPMINTLKRSQASSGGPK
jgi:hypothetical protein